MCVLCFGMKTHQLQHITSAKLAWVNQNHAGKNLCGPAPWLAYKWSRFWGGKDDFSEPQRQFPENLLELRCHRGEGEVFGSRADWPSKARAGNCSAPPEFYLNSRPLPIAPTVAEVPKVCASFTKQAVGFSGRNWRWAQLTDLILSLYTSYFRDY